MTGWPEWTTTVQDADGNPVAFVRGTFILAPGGGWLAHHEPAPDYRGGRFLGPDRREVAQWRADSAGTLLQFQPAVRDQPFVKMALLAAMLAANVGAKRR
jgi:hypothetical protein